MQLPLVSHPAYSFSFPSRHRFPMEKFGLILEYLQAKNIANRNNIFRPGPINKALLALSHCEHYINRFVTNSLQVNEKKQLGLPWSEGLLKRTLISPNGTLLAAKLALHHGIACHLAGGTHHAHYDRGSGFCIFNDLAVTAKTLLWQGQINKVIIFDCDVHQGDGTATILQNESRAVTVSIHCEQNFPAKKCQSDVDVALPLGTLDADYLDIVRNTFTGVLNQYNPDLVIYDAGVDVYERDPLGRLNITEEGIRQRDRFVLLACKQNNIPVMTVIGGGYDDDRRALARRHAIVTEEAHALWCNRL